MEVMTARCTVMFWVMFCLEIMCPVIYMKSTFSHTIYLIIIEDQLHHSTTCSDSSSIFHYNTLLCYIAQVVQKQFQEYEKDITVLPWLLNLPYLNYIECLWVMLDDSAKHPPCKWHQLNNLLYYVTSRHHILDETTSDLV